MSEFRRLVFIVEDALLADRVAKFRIMVADEVEPSEAVCRGVT